jgi:hypothetical protein
MTVHVTNAKGEIAITRLAAWCRILDAVAEQREALDRRIDHQDPSDTHIDADCQTWGGLAEALADFLDARKSA